MQFLERNKKKIFLISCLLLLLALIGPVASLLNVVLVTIQPYFYSAVSFNFSRFFRVLARNIGSFIPGILSCFGSFITLLCFAFAAFHSFRTGKRSIFTAIGGVLLVLGVLFSVITTLIASIAGISQAGSYSGSATMIGTYIGSLIGVITGGLGSLVLAAYFIVFCFVKPKGPAIPIVGAALIVLIMLIPAVLGLFTPFISLFTSYFALWNLLSFLFGGISAIGSLAYSVGLLLHVPLSFYEPKVVAQIDEADFEEVVENTDKI